LKVEKVEIGLTQKPITFWGPIPLQKKTKKKVHVNFNPSLYNCKSNEDIKTRINAIWEEMLQKNPRCFDATKFRQAGLHLEDGRVIIEVGLSSYKEVCGTNLSENCIELRGKGEAEFGDDSAYLSNALGGGLLLVTVDGYVVVGRRASWVCEFPGFLDRPGGHAEPDNVSSLKKETIHARADTDLHQAVFDEIWSFPQQEAEAEYGIGPELMQDYGFLGTVICKVDTYRPSLEFFARLTITSSEMRLLYNKGTQVEANETSGLHMIDPYILGCLLHHLTGKKQETCTCIQREVGENKNKYHKQAANMVHELTPALRGALILAAEILLKNV
ncbi:unnamed protein product, partial [Meganyctiphanes norvegica]